MKSMKYYLMSLLMGAIFAMSFTSCSDDKLGETIFPDEEDVLDPTSATYQLDKWLRDNYLSVYNLNFLYKMEDVGTNMNYNLVPATYENSLDLAVLSKYLWFDVYGKIAGPDFLKMYGPRIIHLIGSPAYNPSSGSMILGLAEGGIKVSLFKVNAMRISDFNMMNEYYFKTMHHEFAHVLHQTKIYPTEFREISAGHYVPSEWRDRGVEIASEGFVTGYAASEYNEDFAETVACYITYTDARWESLLESASCGWHKDKKGNYCRFFYYPDNDATKDAVYVTQGDDLVSTVTDPDGTVHRYYYNANNPRDPFIVYEVEDEDGIDGKKAIEQKVSIARQWFHDAWGIDLDELRQEVRSRQPSYNIVELRKWVTEIQ